MIANRHFSPSQNCRQRSAAGTWTTSWPPAGRSEFARSVRSFSLQLELLYFHFPACQRLPAELWGAHLRKWQTHTLSRPFAQPQFATLFALPQLSGHRAKIETNAARSSGPLVNLEERGVGLTGCPLTGRPTSAPT